MLTTLNGVSPSCVSLPPGPWATVLEFLVARFPAIPADEWFQRLARGHVVDGGGQAVTAHDAYRAHTKLFYYRSLLAEPVVAAQEQVLYEDARIVVADKPHFLAVVPAGQYLQETLLVRLKRRLGLNDLAPMHRIDRETAGLVLFCKHVEHRKAYTSLFAQRKVHKVYEAIAASPRPDTVLRFPMHLSSHLEPARHFMQMRQTDTGTPNAHTTIELLETAGNLARYRLKPTTGLRHQLRVHMVALGLPLVGDRIYPDLKPHLPEDTSNPLRLLAQGLAFTDPYSGEALAFQSTLSLSFI